MRWQGKYSFINYHSEAIKNWYEAYKEENVFTILLNNQCEELLM
jgi:hypothetical protein